MVFQAVDDGMLAALVVDDIGECVEEVDKLIDKLGGAGDQTGDFEEPSLKTGQGTELIVANAKRLIDVNSKGRI